MRPVAFALLASAVLAGGFLFLRRHRPVRPVQPPLEAASALAAPKELPDGATPLLEALRSDLQVHRQLIVLFADEAIFSGPALNQALAVGHRLHHERRELVHQLNKALVQLAARSAPQRDPIISSLLDWMEQDGDLLTPDRLAFRDTLRILLKALQTDSTPEGAALKQRLTRDLAEVDRVEAQVESEYQRVFGGSAAAPKGGARDVWNAYVAELQRRLPVQQLLGSEAIPSPAEKLAGSGEITGTELPDKVLILSFDDGPHRVYTEEIRTLLQKEGVPAMFFEVGRNLGTQEAGGSLKLGHLSTITEDLVKGGFLVGNHSYSHAQLSKETGAPLDQEIRETDQLLRAIPGAHSQLFRFPYGARTAVQLRALEAFQLRSVLWNIDSLDWADPVPSSVADRVLKLITHERRGIILFHDIHDRAGKVLPVLIPRLRAEGYRFATLDPTGKLVLPEAG
ncbi:polysaccharide deacetylase family protein [Geothrix sp. PMB-07]|uniref:polysaccharide deacetylase family protein n=1 Tax=Geothrix sp. PMB-07 TaxID=3068640 RepID=UPI0027403F97|nr:polysaccharide deacetylase family protein [Geothrix sp. PMB-07]WLT32492.1 polysaccharide deacetylase family protein [Geothrix sp. PMB-07]